MSDLQPGPCDAVMGTGRRVRDPKKLLDPMVAEVFKGLRGYVGKEPGVSYDLKCTVEDRSVTATLKEDGTYMVYVEQYFHEYLHAPTGKSWTLTGNVEDLTIAALHEVMYRKVERPTSNVRNARIQSTQNANNVILALQNLGFRDQVT